MLRPVTRTHVTLALFCLAAAVPLARTPTQGPPGDLDTFMKQVLARRDVNRQTLQQYILDDTETFEVLGPGRIPLHRGTREYTWYVRDGVHVRSPIRFDGVKVGDADRRTYEEDWLRRERARVERRNARDARRSGADDDTSPGGPPVSGDTPIATPRFVSEAYFMDFKFEPGNYYLAGREQIEGKDVLRIEYYPTQMFNDSEHDDDPPAKGKPAPPPKPPGARERKREEDVSRKMNKTALITLWVDPAEHQIVKYTFDNVWMDFLPGAWLVRVDDIHASMTMGQPFPGVWLPRAMNVQAGVSLATGPFSATYTRQFTNYKLADVTSIIRIPKQDREPEVQRVQGVHGVHGPAVEEDEPQSQPEVIREIRVHGNAAVADEAVIALAGVSIGQTLTPDAVEAIGKRLEASGRFESVDVRKRYRSLTDATDVAIVLVVHERPGVISSGGAVRRASRPFGRVGERLMFLPIVNYTDGYGLTYGGRFSTTGLLGGGEHLSAPFTWGGTRRVALELERGFKTGPLTRIASSVGIRQRENPRFRIDDRRVTLQGRAERALGGLVRTGVDVSRSWIDFGGLDDRLWTAGADATLDTRRDPAFPRNAVVVGAGWTGLHFRDRPQRINRYTTDARGYVGLVGQAVAAARLQYTAADARLPAYERLLLGGASTLRGFRAGTFDGDRTLVTSAEVRVPITSVLSSARLGLTGFVDAARAWDHGSRLGGASWHTGPGAGLFLIAPLVKLNLDLAHGLKGGDTRVHLAAGFSF